jgi:transcriptional regulator with XRE-family HTH domain
MKRMKKRKLIIDCKALADLCIARYMTATDLAHASGITRRTITQILYTPAAGTTVQIKTAYRLAQALQVPVDAILYKSYDDSKEGA